jgi:hypothetical protein
MPCKSNPSEKEHLELKKKKEDLDIQWRLSQTTPPNDQNYPKGNASATSGAFVTPCSAAKGIPPHSSLSKQRSSNASAHAPNSTAPTQTQGEEHHHTKENKHSDNSDSEKQEYQESPELSVETTPVIRYSRITGEPLPPRRTQEESPNGNTNKADPQPQPSSFPLCRPRVEKAAPALNHALPESDNVALPVIHVTTHEEATSTSTAAVNVTGLKTAPKTTMAQSEHASNNQKQRTAPLPEKSLESSKKKGLESKRKELKETPPANRSDTNKAELSSNRCHLAVSHSTLQQDSTTKQSDNNVGKSTDRLATRRQGALVCSLQGSKQPGPEPEPRRGRGRPPSVDKREAAVHVQTRTTKCAPAECEISVNVKKEAIGIHQLERLTAINVAKGHNIKKSPPSRKSSRLSPTGIKAASPPPPRRSLVSANSSLPELGGVSCLAGRTPSRKKKTADSAILSQQLPSPEKQKGSSSLCQTHLSTPDAKSTRLSRSSHGLINNSTPDVNQGAPSPKEHDPIMTTSRRISSRLTETTTNIAKEAIPPRKGRKDSKDLTTNIAKEAIPPSRKGRKDSKDLTSQHSQVERTPAHKPAAAAKCQKASSSKEEAKAGEKRVRAGSSSSAVKQARKSEAVSGTRRNSRRNAVSDDTTMTPAQKELAQKLRTYMFESLNDPHRTDSLLDSAEHRSKIEKYANRFQVKDSLLARFLEGDKKRMSSERMHSDIEHSIIEMLYHPQNHPQNHPQAGKLKYVQDLHKLIPEYTPTPVHAEQISSPPRGSRTPHEKANAAIRGSLHESARGLFSKESPPRKKINDTSEITQHEGSPPKIPQLTGLKKPGETEPTNLNVLDESAPDPSSEKSPHGGSTAKQVVHDTEPSRVAEPALSDRLSLNASDQPEEGLASQAPTPAAADPNGAGEPALEESFNRGAQGEAISAGSLEGIALADDVPDSRCSPGVDATEHIPAPERSVAVDGSDGAGASPDEMIESTTTKFSERRDDFDNSGASASYAKDLNARTAELDSGASDQNGCHVEQRKDVASGVAIENLKVNTAKKVSVLEALDGKGRSDEPLRSDLLKATDDIELNAPRKSNLEKLGPKRSSSEQGSTNTDALQAPNATDTRLSKKSAHSALDSEGCAIELDITVVPPTTSTEKDHRILNGGTPGGVNLEEPREAKKIKSDAQEVATKLNSVAEHEYPVDVSRQKPPQGMLEEGVDSEALNPSNVNPPKRASAGPLNLEMPQDGHTKHDARAAEPPVLKPPGVPQTFSGEHIPFRLSSASDGNSLNAVTKGMLGALGEPRRERRASVKPEVIVKLDCETGGKSASGQPRSRRSPPFAVRGNVVVKSASSFVDMTMSKEPTVEYLHPNGVNDKSIKSDTFDSPPGYAGQNASSPEPKTRRSPRRRLESEEVPANHSDEAPAGITYSPGNASQSASSPEPNVRRSPRRRLHSEEVPAHHSDELPAGISQSAGYTALNASSPEPKTRRSPRRRLLSEEVPAHHSDEAPAEISQSPGCTALNASLPEPNVRRSPRRRLHSDGMVVESVASNNAFSNPLTQNTLSRLAIHQPNEAAVATKEERLTASNEKQSSVSVKYQCSPLLPTRPSQSHAADKALARDTSMISSPSSKRQILRSCDHKLEAAAATSALDHLKVATKQELGFKCSPLDSTRPGRAAVPGTPTPSAARRSLRSPGSPEEGEIIDTEENSPARRSSSRSAVPQKRAAQNWSSEPTIMPIAKRRCEIPRFNNHSPNVRHVSRHVIGSKLNILARSQFHPPAQMVTMSQAQKAKANALGSYLFFSSGNRSRPRQSFTEIQDSAARGSRGGRHSILDYLDAGKHHLIYKFARSIPMAPGHLMRYLEGEQMYPNTEDAIFKYVQRQSYQKRVEVMYLKNIYKK